MSYCKSSGEDGKDKVIFLTEEDAAKPSKVELSDDEPSDTPKGLITESGEINWECPCLGGMAVGPCGVEFREAFSCFHYSEEDPKGVECLEVFQKMQDCMKDYPELYDKENEGMETPTSESNSDIKDTDSKSDSKAVEKDSEPDSSNVSDSQMRTNDSVSDTSSHINESSNTSNNSDGSQNELSQAARSQEKEIASELSSKDNEEIVINSVPSMSIKGDNSSQV